MPCAINNVYSHHTLQRTTTKIASIWEQYLYPDLPGTVPVLSPVSRVPADFTSTIVLSHFCAGPVPGVPIFFEINTIRRPLLSVRAIEHPQSTATLSAPRPDVQTG